MEKVCPKGMLSGCRYASARMEPRSHVHIHARLGCSLRRLRVARGYGQTEMARRLGITQAHLSKLERGLAPIGIELLEKWAGVLEAPPWYVMAEAGGDQLQAQIALDVLELLRERPMMASTLRVLLRKPAGETIP